MNLEELQQALANETDATRKQEIQAQINALNNVGHADSVPTSETTQLSAEERARQNVLNSAGGTQSEMSNAVNRYIDMQINRSLNVQLSNGENPSSKYLKQKIITKGLPSRVRAFLDGVGSDYDFVPGDVGKGVEYILTGQGTVCTFDESQFVPDEVYLQENHTYVDTLDIATPGLNSKTWRVDRSKQSWKYVHYFLSGQEDSVINSLISLIEVTFANMMFKKTYETLLDAYNHIVADVTPSTEESPTKYMVGEAESMMDAVEELRNFAMRMLDDNTQFNYGQVKEVEGQETLVPFTDAVNHVSSLDSLKFIVNQETYNAIMKYLPYAYNRDDFINYALKPSSWLIVPKTYTDVDLTVKTVEGEVVPNTQINGQPTLKNTAMFYNASTGKRVKGTVMMIAGNNETLKWGNNYEQHESQYYPSNATTQFFNRKNLNCKILKWGQIGVFQNEHLEDPYSIPVSTSQPVSVEEPVTVVLSDNNR